jgi:hypothetical protein
MLHLYFIVLGIQLNSWFLIKDIQHILNSRFEETYKVSILYGDMEEIRGLVVPTRIPKHAIVAAESSRMHFLLHDSESFRRFLWDGYVSYDEKKEILINVMKWLNQTEHSIQSAQIHDYEDGSIFNEVLEELK